MVARMRERPGGAEMPVAAGDMADVPVSGPKQTITFTAEGMRMLPVALRYCWDRRPYDSGSTKHLSVYRPA
jgi:hypothetical protein